MVDRQTDGVTYHRWRWLAFSVFVIASLLNYLDRFLLNQLSPLILSELHLSVTSFGWVLGLAAIVYALGSLVCGFLLDYWGLNRTMFLAVSWWSLSGAATSLVQSLTGLALTRSSLALGESAGIPAVSKVNALYLKPQERALGTALNGLGLSLGLAAAPLFVGLAVHGSWRFPFVVTGILSLLWIPLWLVVGRRIPPNPQPAIVPTPVQQRVGSLSLIVLTNMLWMGAYSLWSNWTTFYYMGVYKLTLQQSAHYTWVPPLISNLGGLFGGWLSARFVQNGREPLSARQKAVWISALGALPTLAVLSIHDPLLGTVFISGSFFCALAGSVNIYAAAIDIFGGRLTGIAVAAMTCAYGLLQAVISPIIGSLVDRGNYQAPVVVATLALVASAAVLSAIRR